MEDDAEKLLQQIKDIEAMFKKAEQDPIMDKIAEQVEILSWELLKTSNEMKALEATINLLKRNIK